MFLQIGKTYLINILSNGKQLTYTGKILEIEFGFVTFTDRYGKDYTYNLNNVISFEEKKDG